MVGELHINETVTKKKVLPHITCDFDLSKLEFHISSFLTLESYEML